MGVINKEPPDGEQMDPKIKAKYEKLKRIRTATDLSVKPSKHLKDTYIGFDGAEHPLKFRDYQVKGVLHLASMARFLLGDDTGLGKTLQSIGALCYIWDKVPDQKVIVLTNKSAVQQWSDEFDKFTTGIEVLVVKGTPAKRRKVYDRYETKLGSCVLVMGYRTAVQDFSRLQMWEDYVVIFDEATAFKNSSTQVHQVCRHLSAKAKRVWALTATLIKNNLVEGYGIYKVIIPNLFTTKNRFMVEYCIIKMQQIPRSKRQIPIIVGYRKRDIEAFKEKIDPYFLGRPKFEVAEELPSLTMREIHLEMTKAQEAKYAEALSGVLEVGEGDETEEKETTKLTALIYCQQIVDDLGLIDCTGTSPKAEALIDLLGGGDLEGEKVIVFSRFKKMVNLLEIALKKAKIGCVRITGDENVNQRRDAAKSFQDSESDVKVVFITMAGAEAINLQAAKAVVFYDSPWSAGDYLQILGRMIRIGSGHDRVYAVHLVMENTVDNRVMETLQRKMVLIESVIGKRLKGSVEDREDIMVGEGDINQLFKLLRKDAKDRRG